MNIPGSEVVMKQIVFALLAICLVCSDAISQVSPKNGQPQRTPVLTQTGPPSPQQAPLAQGVKPFVGAPVQPTPPTNALEDFVIGPEDVLEIKVWREPELTTKAVVRPDGKIGMTLLGDMPASGLTTTQLKQAVTDRLARLLEAPEVSVVVVEIRSQMVHLIGMVGRPGAYALGGPLTVVELLARAGGLTETAKSEEIAIVRNKGGGVMERISFNYKAFIEGRDLRGNIPLKHGDVVVVR
jgi:polysaccharide biosynthesis/export protein